MGIPLVILLAFIFASEALKALGKSEEFSWTWEIQMSRNLLKMEVELGQEQKT